ncbi:c-type cytochrome [Burkholderia pseudomallei]|uniref:c-type cytochrome n=1 Tax=Burkholderia pseudomallei TaxID=28450 RepID=UPI0009B59BE4|nr:c-type cytochrome [Burkholderia pseudomallei]OND85878.1 cytochrome C [Burkholderia pseudomallei]WCE18601.1 c-type cytochrome [Burkholderia pseudomallei]
MSTERLFSIRNRWLTVSVGLTLFAVVASVLIGFVWLPSVQKDAQFQGIWNAICSAAGVPRAWLPSQQEPVPSAVRTSTVVVTPQMMAGADSLSIGRGATLAMRCTMCHGARGMSDANSPNLAGQYAAVIYKQLKDFQTGARTNAVMVPMVVNLSDQDMRDLAAFYSYLPRTATALAVAPPRIVASGAPMRNIAPCASCHGGMDNKVGGPRLEGEPEIYINAQLQAFASGARHNDISEQMRNVARQMTPAEIAAAARYYAGRP